MTHLAPVSPTYCPHERLRWRSPRAAFSSAAPSMPPRSTPCGAAEGSEFRHCRLIPCLIPNHGHSVQPGALRVLQEPVFGEYKRKPKHPSRTFNAVRAPRTWPSRSRGRASCGRGQEPVVRFPAIEITLNVGNREIIGLCTFPEELRNKGSLLPKSTASSGCSARMWCVSVTP